MSEIFEINSITQIHQGLGLENPKHPLVSVVYDKDATPPKDLNNTKIMVNLYRVILKGKVGCGDLRYGKNSYDYEEGTLLFTAPGQVTEFNVNESQNMEGQDGWTLAFHPDLIRKSDLLEKMKMYSFFDYIVNEALHLSDEERKTIEDLIKKIIKEYSLNLDRHSQNLIISNIELLLDYSLRFYERQFYTRTNLNSDVVTQFEQLLKRYYESDTALEQGVPNVGYFANELLFSKNYLSDLLKKETGKTAKEHIHLHIIERAKSKLMNSSLSISEIGYDLGFEYPQHFSNLFKTKTGLTPKEYRNLN